MSRKILFVDDEPSILRGIQRNFFDRFEIETAEGGPAGLAKFRSEGPFAVVVSDMRMPEINGTALLSEIRNIAPDTVRILLTGQADLNDAIEVINKGGIFRFLTKPCPPDLMERTLQEAIRQYELVIAERELLDQTLQGAIKVLIEIGATALPRAHQQAIALRKYVRDIAIDLETPNLWELEISSLFARIGELAIPGEVISKHTENQPLSRIEKELLTRVPLEGNILLKSIPRLEGVAANILYHEKNFDGSGFPEDAVAGEEIPFGARLIHLVRHFVVLKSKGLPDPAIRASLKRNATNFDPGLLEAVLGGVGKLFSGEEGEVTAIPIRFVELEPGQRLAAEMVAGNGQLLLEKESLVTPAIIQRLKNWSRITRVKEPIFIYPS